jgi:hypothetical protein
MSMICFVRFSLAYQLNLAIVHVAIQHTQCSQRIERLAMASLIQYQEHWNTMVRIDYVNIWKSMDIMNLRCFSHELWYPRVCEAIFLDRLWYRLVNTAHSSIVMLNDWKTMNSHRWVIIIDLVSTFIIDFSSSSHNEHVLFSTCLCACCLIICRCM